MATARMSAVIAGGGIGGLAAAIALARRGIDEGQPVLARCHRDHPAIGRDLTGILARRADPPRLEAARRHLP